MRTQGSVGVPRSRLLDQTLVPCFFIPSVTLPAGRSRLRTPHHTEVSRSRGFQTQWEGQTEDTRQAMSKGGVHKKPWRMWLCDSSSVTFWRRHSYGDRERGGWQSGSHGGG